MAKYRYVNLDGKQLLLGEAAARLKMPKSTLAYGLNKGLSAEETYRWWFEKKDRKNAHVDCLQCGKRITYGEHGGCWVSWQRRKYCSVKCGQLAQRDYGNKVRQRKLKRPSLKLKNTTEKLITELSSSVQEALLIELRMRIVDKILVPLEPIRGLFHALRKELKRDRTLSGR